MKQATLARRHRRERKGLAGCADLLDGHLGHEVELPDAVCLEALGVEGDAVVVLGFEAKDLGGDVLNGVQEFPVAGEEERGIGAAEFDCDLGGGVRRG